MREALLMFGFNLVLGGIISALGWKFFLPSAQNTESIAALLKNPALLLLLGVVVAPLWEELVFRGLPSWLLRRVRRNQNQSLATRDVWFWTLCVVSSFAFAIVHGANDKGEIHLPLPQLVMGFLLWRVAIERGLRYSILMHATYNAVAVGLVLSASQLAPTTPKKTEVAPRTPVSQTTTATSSTR